MGHELWAQTLTNQEGDLTGCITSDRFASWYKRETVARNIRNGTPWFNGASTIPPPEKHTPSALLQCHRKIVYRQENAPAETPTPRGMYWVGRQLETDLIRPFLENAIDADHFISPGCWFDTAIEVADKELKLSGETDPAVVTAEGDPLLVTEVKTRESIDGELSPSLHHRAQLQAYLAGLAETHDQQPPEGLLLYIDRTTLELHVVEESFDSGFWDHVKEWIWEQTRFRTNHSLPPADPVAGWECDYCPYARRCGQTDDPVTDLGVEGFIPGDDRYPRDRVVEYARTRPDDEASLTPTLAHQYPDLADRFGVVDWECNSCERTWEWQVIDPTDDIHPQPVCPGCADSGNLETVSASTPTSTP